MAGRVSAPLLMVGARLLQGIPLVAGTVLLNFLVIHAAPGDPATILAGQSGLSGAQTAHLREELGLDQPLVVQFFHYVGGLLQGDLGVSYAYRQPVWEVISARLPATLLLMGASYLVAAIIGIVVGSVAAARPGSFIDRIIMVFAVLGQAVPAFVIGFLLLTVFSVRLRWLPLSGMNTPGGGGNEVFDVFRHMVLPVTVLAMFFTGLIARLMRTSMANALGSDFIVTERAAGLSRRRILTRHALPNAITPIITVLGLQIGLMLAGAVMTETVFGWPGLGTMAVTAVGARDYPVLLGIFLLSSVMVIVASLLTDIAYTLVDPRRRRD